MSTIKVSISSDSNDQHDRRFRPGREAARFETYESMLWLAFLFFLYSLFDCMVGGLARYGLRLLDTPNASKGSLVGSKLRHKQ